MMLASSNIWQSCFTCHAIVKGLYGTAVLIKTLQFRLLVLLIFD